MAKMPMDWHKQSLLNSRISLATAERQVSRQMEAIQRQRERVEFYEQQVREAEKRGLDGFDGERFMKKRFV